MKLRNIAILAIPGVQLLDVSGPLDVFAEANLQSGMEAYRPVVIASSHGHIRSSSGVRAGQAGSCTHQIDRPRC